VSAGVSVRVLVVGGLTRLDELYRTAPLSVEGVEIDRQAFVTARERASQGRARLHRVEVL
jgi:hypothetical protein